MRKLLSLTLLAGIVALIAVAPTDAGNVDRAVLRISNVTTSTTPTAVTNDTYSIGLIERIRIDVSASADMDVDVLLDDGTVLFTADDVTADVNQLYRFADTDIAGTEVTNSLVKFPIKNKLILQAGDSGTNTHDVAAYIYFSESP
jgi:hypothetical protein